MKQNIESQLYRWGLAFFAVVAAAVIIKRLAFPEFDILRVVSPCIFRRMTGYFCPGCGGTRSCVALFSGRFLVSAVDFPMVMYCAIIYAWFMISHTIEKISRNTIRIGMKFRFAWIYASLIIVAIHWAAKNVFYIVTGLEPFL